MKRQRALLFFTILVLLLVAGCGGSPKKPDKAAMPGWVSTGEHKTYPSAMYLVGTGQGITKEVANNAARAELLKTIRVRVREELSSTEEVQQSIRDNKMRESVNRNIRRDINSSTDIEIQGIEIAESWLNPATGQHHSFAVLDRQQAESRFRREISDIDTQILSLMSRSGGADDKLRAVGYVLQAKRHAAKRQLLNEYLSVVSLSGSGVGPDATQTELDEKLDSLQQAIVFAVEGQGDYASEVARFAQGEMAEAGFRMAESGEADYVLNVDLSLQDPARQQQWFWVRGKLDASLVSVATSEVKGSHTWALKQSATDADTAIERAIAKVKTIFADDLASVVIGFAERE